MTKIKSKILVKGVVENISPIIIGKGKSEGWVDIEVIKDEKGNFYIPGTSFKGALRHFIQENFNILNKDLDKFFGSQESQAIAIFDDLVPKKPTATEKRDGVAIDLSPSKEDDIEPVTTTEIRDGVAIDYKTNIAKEGAKYDYEVVPAGYSFDLSIEINIYDDLNEKDVYRMLATINHVLKNENKRFCLGAMTTKGFGVVKLKNQEDLKAYKFEPISELSSNPWIKYLLKKSLPEEFNFSDYSPYDYKSNNYFSISASFRIKNSLIIGSSPSVDDEADKVPLKSNGKWVLPGTSVKGAIRSRAERIINTLGGNGQELLKNTFGWADTNNSGEKTKIKSRLKIHETILKDVTEKLKHGIKIDRFTGGTIDSALFSTVLLWSKGEDSVHIRMELKNAEDWEKGLLLLILKDLFISDLPIGGDKARGAGVLKGKSAEIDDNGTIYIIKENMLISGEKEKLEKYIIALNEKVKSQKN